MKMTAYAHQLLQSCITEGDVVIDATVGNGHDTLFLARLIGDQGHVYGFDVQPLAIETTRSRIKEENLLHRVTLIEDGHQNLDQYIDENRQIKGTIFNLGYLPGSDKKITTRGEYTLQALEKMISRLHPQGLIIVVVYWGHEQGKIEKTYLESRLADWDPSQVIVSKYEHINRHNAPPYLLLIHKNNIQ